MLTAKEYRQRTIDELANAEKWIAEMCSGYEEVIICSDHYPFGTDAPVCMWIKPEQNMYKAYCADWDLFDVGYLPNKFLTNKYLANDSDKFFIQKVKGKYGWDDAAEVEPFGFVDKKFKNDRDVYQRNSLHDLLYAAFSYVIDEYSHEAYLNVCEECGKDIEERRAEYAITDFSRIESDCGYCGGLYLNLYLVARK